MTIQVIMPQMGESVFEGTLTKWLKKVGDTVVRDESLFEISTDKVDSEIPSPASGILTEILVPEGKTIQINTVLATIEEAESSETKATEPDTQKAAAPEAEAPEVEVLEKTASSTPSSEDASSSQKTEESPEEKPEKPQLSAEPEKPKQGRPDVKKDSKAQKPVPAAPIQDIRTSPLVRRLAREHSVDLSEIRGTGLEGRITKQDMLDFLEKRAAGESEPEAPHPVPAETPDSKSAPQPEPSTPSPSIPAAGPRFMGETETVPMTPMRKAVAEHMVLSKKTSAHVNTVFEVDMTAIVRLREINKAEFQRREGIPLTYTPFFAKALVDNVRDFPSFNASISGDNIIYKKPINIGIAVALEKGLIVPVIKNAQLKSFTGIALAIHDLAERARSKRLKADDVQDGTISMTNPGSFGALFATPIISQPQVAILGVGGIEKRPVVVDDAIAIRSMACLSLTFDHRLIDGAEADQFMAKLKERLQAWAQWAD